MFISECFESLQKSGKWGVILHVFQEHLKTGWLTLLMPTKLEAKVMLQDDRHAQFSLTVDLLKNALWLIIGKKERGRNGLTVFQIKSFHCLFST